MHDAVIIMMTSQILKPAGFTKTQKSCYLENETLFFLQIKKFINHIKRCFITKNSFVAEVTFNALTVYFVKHFILVQLQETGAALWNLSPINTK